MAASRVRGGRTRLPGGMVVLMLTRWSDEHADFWWKRNRSEDEDASRLALSILGTDYLMPEKARWMHIAFTCYWQGQAYFVHRCGGNSWGRNRGSIGACRWRGGLWKSTVA